MKKTIFTWVVVLAFLLPAPGSASYILHLTNGGRYMTPQYWEEGLFVHFYIPGGIMGIEKRSIKKIERSDLDLRAMVEAKTPPPPPAPVEQKDETRGAEERKVQGPSTPKPPAEVDLTAFREIMDNLKRDLNQTLARIRKATAMNDLAAKDEATAENQTISAEMWKLTTEVQKKNNGKLPADWWEGIGREAPAAP